MVNSTETPRTPSLLSLGSRREGKSEECGFYIHDLLVSDLWPLSENLLNNLKHIEDLTQVLKKEKEKKPKKQTTFLLLLPSFMENVVSFYFVARRADSYRFNP